MAAPTEANPPPIVTADTVSRPDRPTTTNNAPVRKVTTQAVKSQDNPRNDRYTTPTPKAKRTVIPVKATRAPGIAAAEVDPSTVGNKGAASPAPATPVATNCAHDSEAGM